MGGEAMYDDDRDALAAEYVLGTLSGDERAQAETLMSIDPAFEAVVRQWERRLGELNVMVEAVEPEPEVWERIQASIRPAPTIAPIISPPSTGDDEEEVKLPRIDDAELQAPQTPEIQSPVAALASSLLPADPEPQPGKPAEAPAVGVAARPSAPEAAPGEPKKIERSADVIYLAGKVKRWRRLTLAVGALAAVLALYIAVGQFAPDLIPYDLRLPGSPMTAQGTGRGPQDGLVVVLQQEPTAPAFLLTLDTQKRMLTVRRVSATPETGRSYELWVISSRSPSPRSLGVVGNDEFTQRALPGNFDAATLRAASYAVSLEPAGGSTTGAPTGPILFTGKAVDSLPGNSKT
jgi:anti-sigma-K factor RskA